MMRFFSQAESRRKSRRFVPGGQHAGISVEYLEVRAMLDGSGGDQIPQGATDLIELINTDLTQMVGSGDENVDFDAMNVPGDDELVIHEGIEVARNGINGVLDGKTTAWNNYKTKLQSDLIRIDDYATSQSWASDWKTAANPNTTQAAFRDLISQIGIKMTQADSQLTRIAIAKTFDNDVLDFMHDLIEHHEAPAPDGGVRTWMTLVSFNEAADEYLDSIGV